MHSSDEEELFLNYGSIDVKKTAFSMEEAHGIAFLALQEVKRTQYVKNYAEASIAREAYH